MAYSSMVEHSLGVCVSRHEDQGDDVGSIPAMPTKKPSIKFEGF